MIRVDVQKQLGAFALDAQFTAPAGITAIFGRSGAGKSSLIRAIAGLMTPDQGQVEIAGRVLFDTSRNLAPHRRNLGVVFQEPRLFPHMTVAQNLCYGGRHDWGAVIDLLGLAPLLTRYPAKLSGGEAQRVALGRALMSNPAALLLDEPLAALDAARKEEILPYIERLRDDANLPMIYVSHDIAEVARIATSLVLLDAGRVTASGPLEDVLSSPSSLRLLGPRDAGAVISATITAHHTDDALTIVAFDGGTLSLPHIPRDIGQILRLRIPAQDIILAAQKPIGISARNIIPVKITDISQGKGPGAAVKLIAGNTPLLARITGASLRDMDLSVGDDIYAIIKATAVAPKG